MIIDTHAHCYWETLEPRIDEIIANMQKNGVTLAVQIGCDIESSEKAIALARRFPWIFLATVGLHPETAQDNYELWIMNYEWKAMSNSKKKLKQMNELISGNRDSIVGIGETGFDFHYLDGSDGGKIRVDLDHLSDKAREQIENQKYWWREQWKLAQKYNLPLVIHTRDAREATLEFMKAEWVNRAVMHCFSEDWEFARELLNFSSEIYFSFSWILTYKSAIKIQEAAQKIPLDRILLETDSPFLAPVPLRWTVNEPANTHYTLEKLIELRTESREEMTQKVYENSKRFYSI